MKILITGSLGLVGSEAVRFYIDRGAFVIGVDNDMRRHFFGEDASGVKNMMEHGHYMHCGKDISQIEFLIAGEKPDVIIHAAGQPSHDYSAKEPILDFQANAIGTLFLLEMARKYVPGCVFIYCSTNKVYGDNPNKLNFIESDTRYIPTGGKVIDESMSLDQCIHSPFGVSKLAGDLYCQEYARYYGMKTGIFRMGCITGARHAGAELHGFLSYMVKCKKENKRYKIYGYNGKQVRDNIHAFDLVNCFDQYIRAPKLGEVYNMGGGLHSNISVLEALGKLKLDYEYLQTPRIGDHKWYISDVSKFQRDYPEWKYKYNLEAIFEDLLSAQPV